MNSQTRRDFAFYSRGCRLCFYYLPLAVAGICLCLLLSASVARAAGLDEVAAGQLLLTSGNGDYRQAVSQRSRVHFDISGMIARVQLEQEFRNDSGDWAEGVYAFPLPERAAVRAMEMVLGERRIVGRIKEKSLAKQIYQQAKREGKKAALVEQQRPNLFTNRVANIAPGESVRVTLEYVQELDYVRGVFSLRFPMTLTPRYIPGQPLPRAEEEPSLAGEFELNPYGGWAVATDQVPDAAAITPLLHPGAGTALVNPIEISAELDMGVPLARVESPYHPLALERDGGRYRLQLAAGRVEMNRDFLLQFEPVTGRAPAAALFTETVDGQHYGLLMVLPPAVRGAEQALPRETVFVIDTSGSMGGVSIQQARESLMLALRQLRPQDQFNVIEFNSSYRMLFRGAQPASRHNVQRALEFVRQLDAGGGTEMLPALAAALAPSRMEESGRLRQVVFITDGAVGNEAALFEEISRRLGNQRLFTVGIGSAPNSWFMRKAAEFGRGTHVHIGDISEVSSRMARLLETIAAPLAADIEITWPVAVEAWPARVPDLYAGEPVVVAVRFSEAATVGDIELTGSLRGTDWQRRLSLPAAGERGDHPGVASVWARRKITALLDSRVTGTAEDAIREAVLPLALEHSLMSPYTSFVAVEEKISRPAAADLKKSPVPNSRPAGQASQPFAYPRTATLAPLHTWLGCLALFLALMCYTLARPEPDCVPV